MWLIGEIIIACTSNSAIARVFKEGANYVGIHEVFFTGNSSYGLDRNAVPRYRKGDRVLIVRDLGVYYCVAKLTKKPLKDEPVPLGNVIRDPYLSHGRFSRFLYKLLFSTRVGFIINALTRKIKIWAGWLNFTWDGGGLNLEGGDEPSFELTFHSKFQDLKQVLGPEASFTVKGEDNTITFKIGQVVIEEDEKSILSTTVGSVDTNSDRTVTTSGTLFWERRKTLDTEDSLYAEFTRLEVSEENDIILSSNSGNFDFSTTKDIHWRVLDSGGTTVLEVFLNSNSNSILVKGNNINLEGDLIKIKGKTEIN